ncbi:MAG TPA: hypothetical protein QGG47_03230 [Acidobacteriota bacterium]|nr:hypothetical protein [Acidobacteriota bacterium]
MRRSINWKKVLLVTWAVLLVFSLSFQAEQADALDSACWRECHNDCEMCGGYTGYGCNCSWSCAEGGGGTSSCAVL